MCGIAGFIDFKNCSNKEILTNMTDAMAYRGPDSSGHSVSKIDRATVGLGHRRLAILDLSQCGHQPMGHEQYTIVFNGEIYNFQEIKDDLIDLGYEFESTSDTEVILKSFHYWGKEAVHRFNGMFVFALSDKKNNEVLIYRDRTGVKPLYYYQGEGLSLFASELKSFHEHPAFKKEIDTNALALYLKNGYIPAPHCIFKDARKLDPGYYLKIDCGIGTIEKIKYWDAYEHYNKPKLEISEEEALQSTKKLLVSACNYRMVSDVPVGVFLSGGYDSSAVAALIQTEQSKQLKTFTIGFEEAKFNEAVYAKKVAAYLGTDHYEHICTTKEAQEIIPSLPLYYDEPFADSSAIPTILVSQHAKKHVTVALSADGGDETFAGYGKHANILKNVAQFGKAPKIFHPLIGNAMNLFSAEPFLMLGKRKKHRFEHNYYNLAEAFKEKITVGSLLKYSTQRIYKKELSRLMTSSYSDTYSYFDSENELNAYNDELNTLIAIDYKTYLPDDILTKVDRATMSVSLEGREPLLDYRIIEYVARLPSSYKIKNGVQKYLLKEIVHQVLPKELMERPKMGFGVPIVNWFRKDLKEYFDEYLSADRLKKHGLFNADLVLKMKEGYFNGDDDNFEFLWFLLMFQMWYDEWM